MSPKWLLCLGGRQGGTLNASTRNPLKAIATVYVTAVLVVVACWETSFAGGMIQEPSASEDDSCYQHLQNKALGTFSDMGGQPACLALSCSIVLDIGELGLRPPGAASTPRRKLLQEEGAILCS